jgi:putative phosphoserine phosphatase/1-acylglycerol-3-phosphate O-acyltransferase
MESVPEAIALEDVLAHPEKYRDQVLEIVLFDIDGTMLHGSIVAQLTRQAFAEGQGQVLMLMKFLTCFVLYKLNLIPPLTMYRWGFECAAGRHLLEARGFVDRCLERYIKPRVYRRAMEAVAAHRAAGHICVAVTGAPDYAAAEVATYLGMDDVLATATPLSDDGRLTTELKEPVCYADGKLGYVRAYAALHDVDLSRSFFYSDSASDIPVLKVVGRPRVVNPQLLLRMSAKWRNWPCTRWQVIDRGGIPVACFSRAAGSSRSQPM